MAFFPFTASTECRKESMRPETGRSDRRARPFWPTISSPNGIRQAALVFLAVGVVGLINDFLPGGAGRGHPWSPVLDSLTLLVGGATWLVWNRKPLLQPLAYAIPLIALVLIALNNEAGALPPATLGIWFVLMYVCVGSWYPRGTVLLSSPLAVAAYVLPLVFGAPRSHDDLISALLVIPTAVLAGEIVSANSESLRAAHAAQQQLLAELTRETVTDPLTRLGNRRFGEVLLQSIEPGDVLAILDLDHLKEVNDTFGHRGGDEELKSFGQFLHQSVRDNDAVARFGGDEFLLVMRKAGSEGLEIVERLVAEWGRLSRRGTMSAGVAIHAAGVSSETTYADADDALYTAKRGGGGTCVLAPARSTRAQASRAVPVSSPTWSITAESS